MQTQNSLTSLATKGSAIIIVFIILLLTLGGAAVYFKNFPLEKLPTGEPTEQRGVVVTSTIQSELEICREMTKKYKEERDKFLGEYNSYSKAEIGIMPTEEKDALEQRFLDLEKKVNEWDRKCRNIPQSSQKTEAAVTSNIEIDVIDSEAKSRDYKRVTDIEKIQDAIEYNFDDVQGYPIVNPIADVGKGLKITATSTGWSLGRIFYHGVLPTNPTPGGTTYQYCSANAAGVCYAPPKGEIARNYKITFTLEEGISGFTAGKHTITHKDWTKGSDAEEYVDVRLNPTFNN